MRSPATQNEERAGGEGEGRGVTHRTFLARPGSTLVKCRNAKKSAGQRSGGALLCYESKELLHQRLQSNESSAVLILWEGLRRANEKLGHSAGGGGGPDLAEPMKYLTVARCVCT